MKKLLFTSFLISVFTIAFSQPKLEFDETTHNFGAIEETTGLAKTTFTFTNAGDKPVLVENARASCGCTTPVWSKEPVPPGQKGTIEVAYNPKNRPGAFNKSITIYSNAEPKITQLMIRGTVNPREKTVEELYPRIMGPLRTRSNYVSFGPVLNTQIKTQKIEFVNISEEPVKIGIYRSIPHISVEMGEEAILPNEKGSLTIHYDASKKKSFGYSNDRIYLTMNGERQSNFNISITATIKEDFSKLSEEQLAMAPSAVISESRFDFGTIQQGDKVAHDFMLSNEGKSTLFLRNVKTSCGCTAVEYDKEIAPGESTTLHVVFNSRGKRNRQNKTITIICNDPNNSTIVLRMVGTVQTTN